MLKITTNRQINHTVVDAGSKNSFNREYSPELTSHEQAIYNNCPDAMPHDKRIEYINHERYIAINEPLGFNLDQCEGRKNFKFELIRFYNAWVN